MVVVCVVRRRIPAGTVAGVPDSRLQATVCSNTNMRFTTNEILLLCTSSYTTPFIRFLYTLDYFMLQLHGPILFYSKMLSTGVTQLSSVQNSTVMSILTEQHTIR